MPCEHMGNKSWSFIRRANALQHLITGRQTVAQEEPRESFHHDRLVKPDV